MRSRASFPWLPEHVARLSELWVEGWRTAAIAAELGGGCSKNAVIGKARRLGLPPHRKAVWTRTVRRKRYPQTRAQPARKGGDATASEPAFAAPHRHEAPPLVAPPTWGWPLLDLKPGQCRWPEGHQAPYTFCGAPQQEGSSYCPEHRMRSLAPSEQRNYDPERRRAMALKHWVTKAVVLA